MRLEARLTTNSLHTARELTHVSPNSLKSKIFQICTTSRLLGFFCCEKAVNLYLKGKIQEYQLVYDQAGGGSHLLEWWLQRISQPREFPWIPTCLSFSLVQEYRTIQYYTSICKSYGFSQGVHDFLWVSSSFYERSLVRWFWLCRGHDWLLCLSAFSLCKVVPHRQLLFGPCFCAKSKVVL